MELDGLQRKGMVTRIGYRLKVVVAVAMELVEKSHISPCQPFLQAWDSDGWENSHLHLCPHQPTLLAYTGHLTHDFP